MNLKNKLIDENYSKLKLVNLYNTERKLLETSVEDTKKNEKILLTKLTESSYQVRKSNAVIKKLKEELKKNLESTKQDSEDISKSTREILKNFFYRLDCVTLEDNKEIKKDVKKFTRCEELFQLQNQLRLAENRIKSIEEEKEDVRRRGDLARSNEEKMRHTIKDLSTQISYLLIEKEMKGNCDQCALIQPQTAGTVIEENLVKFTSIQEMQKCHQNALQELRSITKLFEEQTKEFASLKVKKSLLEFQLQSAVKQVALRNLLLSNKSINEKILEETEAVCEPLFSKINLLEKELESSILEKNNNERIFTKELNQLKEKIRNYEVSESKLKHMNDFKNERVQIEKERRIVGLKETMLYEDKMCEYSTLNKQYMETINVLRQELKTSHLALAQQESFYVKIDVTPQVGDKVLARNYRKMKNYWQKATVTKVVNNHLCDVVVNGQLWRRNVDQLRPLSFTSKQAASENEDLERRPLRTFMLSNMFDVSTKTNPHWDEDIRKAVFEECKSRGGATQVHVDQTSEGNVYVHCPTITAAIACVTALNGSWFQNRIIAACYIEENLFYPCVQVKKQTK